MSSKRRRRRHTSSKSLNRRNNNVLVFKIVDPAVQGLLFVLYLLNLDTESDQPYFLILLGLVFLQIISSIINFAVNPPDINKRQRIYYLIALTFGIIFYLAFKGEVYFALKRGMPENIRFYEIIREGIIVIIAFWYNIICFTEIKASLKSWNNDEE
jgi:hypothetical protein